MSAIEQARLDLYLSDPTLSEIPWNLVAEPKDLFKARPRFRRTWLQTGPSRAHSTGAVLRPFRRIPRKIHRPVVIGATSLLRSLIDAEGLLGADDLAYEFMSDTPLLSSEASTRLPSRASSVDSTTRTPRVDAEVITSTNWARGRRNRSPERRAFRDTTPDLEIISVVSDEESCEPQEVFTTHDDIVQMQEIRQPATAPTRSRLTSVRRFVMAHHSSDGGASSRM